MRPSKQPDSSPYCPAGCVYVVRERRIDKLSAECPRCLKFRVPLARPEGCVVMLLRCGVCLALGPA
jgi:hypothetical protein